MSIFDWLRSRRSGSGDKRAANDAEPEPAPVRRRSLQGLAAASQQIEESVSVVLRRQVPVRFGEQHTSWLGGLPHLPAGTEWPRTATGEPLHFIAQVDCTGLPAELWGGLGPRTGHLLLFVDIEAIDGQEDRPYARVLHVDGPGVEAAPPADLYFARNNVFELASVTEAATDRQRRHFRKWPVDLVPFGADIRGLTGSELYGAPEDDHSLMGHDGMPLDRPLTWGGVHDLVAGLIHSTTVGDDGGDDLIRRWGALTDYPEPDVDSYNKEWQERRDQLPERIEFTYHSPEFTAADERLKLQMHEERRSGWSSRAFEVLERETARTLENLEKHSARLASATVADDAAEADSARQSVEYFKSQLAEREEHRRYLTELFASYPSEEALTAEIARTSRELTDWSRKTRQRLCTMLDLIAPIDPATPLAAEDWIDLLAEIASMKNHYWTRTHNTDVLRKVERELHVDPTHVIREDLLDRYAALPPAANGLTADVIANLEPRMRNLECERPHKLGGRIDTVYNEPLKPGHVLLFQMASDAAVGWIFGDLGLVFISIHQDDLATGQFDKAIGWLEA